ncbi:MAG: response regulator [Pseudomonadota bacterium]
MAHILLTEDDEAVRAFVARALTLDNHTVVTACDGEEAFDMLQAEMRARSSNRACGSDGACGFDMLLSDIKMPFMDGIELARHAHDMFPAMPVMLMTGYADQRERAAGVKAVDVVSKPFTLAEIRNAVTAVLGESYATAC